MNDIMFALPGRPIANGPDEVCVRRVRSTSGVGSPKHSGSTPVRSVASSVLTSLTPVGVAPVMDTSAAGVYSDRPNDPWPSAGDLVIHQLGGAPGASKWIEVALWLGNDYPRGIDRAYLYLAQDGTICRAFSSVGFIVVGRLSEAEG